MKCSRVIIVEDDSSLRLSLAEWLSKEYLISQFESAESLLKAIYDFQFEDGIPTCILLDFQMTGMNGVELQNQLCKMNIEFPIIFMSGNAQQADVIDAWHGGAIDFLLKPFASEKLNNALTEIFLKCKEIKSHLPPAIEKNSLIDIPITRREAEVLLLLGEGYRQHEIAERLNISIRTIKWHRASIKHKLNLNTLVEIARYCDEYRHSLDHIAKNH